MPAAVRGWIAPLYARCLAQIFALRRVCSDMYGRISVYVRPTRKPIASMGVSSVHSLISQHGLIVKPMLAARWMIARTALSRSRFDVPIGIMSSI